MTTDALLLLVLMATLAVCGLMLWALSLVVLIVTVFTDGAGWARSIRRAWRTAYATHWKYRDKDPEVCCCGGYIGRDCDYAMGCRSMLEYVITSYAKEPFHVPNPFSRWRDRRNRRARTGWRHQDEPL